MSFISRVYHIGSAPDAKLIDLVEHHTDASIKVLVHGGPDRVVLVLRCFVSMFVLVFIDGSLQGLVS